MRKVDTGKKAQPQGTALLHGLWQFFNGLRGQQITHGQSRSYAALFLFCSLQQLQALPEFYVRSLPSKTILCPGCGTGHGKGYAVQAGGNKLGCLPGAQQTAVGCKTYPAALRLEPADALNQVVKEH